MVLGTITNDILPLSNILKMVTTTILTRVKSLEE